MVGITTPTALSSTRLTGGAVGQILPVSAGSKSGASLSTSITSTVSKLARAKQATSFVNGSGSNPFKDMFRDQLARIAYDDSSTFTVNEQRAAWQEAYDQEEAWRQKVASNSPAFAAATKAMERGRSLPRYEPLVKKQAI